MSSPNYCNFKINVNEKINQFINYKIMSLNNFMFTFIFNSESWLLEEL